MKAYYQIKNADCKYKIPQKNALRLDRLGVGILQNLNEFVLNTNIEQAIVEKLLLMITFTGSYFVW
jgi:hypothetical protein